MLCLGILGRGASARGVKVVDGYVGVGRVPSMSWRLSRFYATKPNVPSIELKMPALSPSMETGKVVSWSKKEGDKIQIGDLIADVETDKATIPMDATEDGILAKILIGNENVRVGSTIAMLVTNPQHVELFKDYTLDSPSTESAPVSSPVPPPPSPDPAPLPTKDYKAPTLVMPAVIPNMEQGTIGAWTKAEGDAVSLGDPIAKIETDKATIDLEAPDDFIIAKILVPVGIAVPVDTPLAIVVKNRGDIEKYKNHTLDMVSRLNLPTTPTPEPTSSVPSSPPVSGATPSPSTAEGGRIFASPIARATASSKGITLSDLNGTGPNSRIILADVLEYTPSAKATQTQTKPQPQVQTSTPSRPLPPAVEDFIDIPNSNIRQIIADRLTFSKQSIPHYYLTVEINVDNLIKLREDLNNFGKSKTGDYKLSLNDFIIKAAGLALRAVPEVNSSWRGDSIRRFNSVHINVAVNTPKGLLTPIVKDVDKIGLKSISTNVKEKASRAVEGKSTMDDLQSGTFTISNLGMFGISQFAAVINPPQAAILAVGTTKRVPTIIDGKVEASNILSVTLSADHRVVDGAVGAQWLQVFKDLLENPIKFLL